MIREAQIIARLEHPGIVPVHDVGTLPDGRIFYAMKYVRGSRLDEYAAQGAPLRDRLRKFQAVCDAVAFAHAHGVIHRDLKPQNIMIGSFGEVLVLDWGVAKISDDPRSSASYQTMEGTRDRHPALHVTRTSARRDRSARRALRYLCTWRVLCFLVNDQPKVSKPAQRSVRKRWRMQRMTGMRLRQSSRRISVTCSTPNLSLRIAKMRSKESVAGLARIAFWSCWCWLTC